MAKLKVTLRTVNDNGEIVAFYYDARRALQCYSLREGECAATLGYMRDCTTYIKIKSELFNAVVSRFSVEWYYKQRISCSDNIAR